MRGYLSPFFLKGKKFPSNLFYAPLAGFTDFPYRKMGAFYKPGLQFCEMVKMEPLVRGDKNTLKILHFEESMRPIGAQICGSQLSLARKSARIIEDLGFDWLDLNCGCPVDRITKDGSGSGMLKNPERIAEMIAELVSEVSIPVSLKIRSGWDERNINAPLVTALAEKAGAALIGIHGRTREQAYRGFSDRAIIKECKKVAKTIKVFGNGDLFKAQDIKDMFEQTLCDGVLISRGTMGQPWIAQEVQDFYEGKNLGWNNQALRKKALLKHFSYIVSFYPEVKALLELRKIGCLYVRDFSGVKAFRRKFHAAQSLAEMSQIIEEVPV